MVSIKLAMRIGRFPLWSLPLPQRHWRDGVCHHWLITQILARFNTKQMRHGIKGSIWVFFSVTQVGVCVQHWWLRHAMTYQITTTYNDLYNSSVMAVQCSACFCISSGLVVHLLYTFCFAMITLCGRMHHSLSPQALHLPHWARPATWQHQKPIAIWAAKPPQQWCKWIQVIINWSSMVSIME